MQKNVSELLRLAEDLIKSADSTGCTPNWPQGEDSTRYDSITISVKITFPMGGRGLNRADVEKICKRLERCAQARSNSRVVSAIL